MMRRREFLYRSTTAVSVAGIASGLVCDRSAIAAENELTANGTHAKTPATPSAQEASSDFKLQLELGSHVVGELFARAREGEQILSRIVRVREELKRQGIVFPIVRIADKLSLPPACYTISVCGLEVYRNWIPQSSAGNPSERKRQPTGIYDMIIADLERAAKYYQSQLIAN